MNNLIRTILIYLLLTSSAWATPCDDASKEFRRAQKYGATNFKCTDHYDGSSSSSWRMSFEQYTRYTTAEMELRKDKIRRVKKEGK